MPICEIGGLNHAPQTPGLKGARQEWMPWPEHKPGFLIILRRMLHSMHQRHIHGCRSSAMANCWLLDSAEIIFLPNVPGVLQARTDGRSPVRAKTDVRNQ